MVAWRRDQGAGTQSLQTLRSCDVWLCSLLLMDLCLKEKAAGFLSGSVLWFCTPTPAFRKSPSGQSWTSRWGDALVTLGGSE